jgi:hypothetical protein
MAKNTENQILPKQTTIISKTMSGNDFLITLQESQGCVHTLQLKKEDSVQLDLGDKIKITIQKVE